MCFVHPNVITVVCFFMIVPILYLMTVKGYIILFLLCVAFRTFLDCLDGSVARSCGSESRIGEISDIMSDFISLVLYLFVFCYVFRKHRVLFVCLVCVSIVFSLIVCFSMVNILRERKDLIFSNVITPILHDNTVLITFVFALLFKTVQSLI
jgi:phosphatidylglycerophosphate synthase